MARLEIESVTNKAGLVNDRKNLMISIHYKLMIQ